MKYSLRREPGDRALRRPHRTKVAVTTLTASVLAVGLASCSGSPIVGGSSSSGGEEDTYSFTVTTTIGGPSGYHNVAISDYMDAVVEASDGRINYEFLYANAIVPPAEVGSAVGSGVVDLSLVVTSYNPSEYPVSNWLSKLAFVGDATAPGLDMQRSAGALEWWFDHEELLQSDFLNQGLMPLTPGVNTINSYQLICREPVTDLRSASGKLVRSPGEAWSDTARAIGMEPISMPGAEIYESLQRGVVDCAMADQPDMVDLGLFEVAKHYTTINAPGFTPYGLFVNADMFRALPADLQQIMWENIDVYVASLISAGLDLRQELLNSPGVEFHTAAEDLVGAVEGLQEKTLSTMAEQAPKQMLDPQKAVDDYVAAQKKWAKIVQEELNTPVFEDWAAWGEAGGTAVGVDTHSFAERLTSEVIGTGPSFAK